MSKDFFQNPVHRVEQQRQDPEQNPGRDSERDSATECRPLSVGEGQQYKQKYFKELVSRASTVLCLFQKTDFKINSPVIIYHIPYSLTTYLF